MPFNQPAPNFGILTVYDMRDYSGVEIFTRSSNSVTLPTFSSGEGVYEDGLFFLNGRACDTQISAAGQIDTVNTFGTGWTVSINDQDRVEIASNVDFTLTSIGSTDIFGAGAGAVSATLDGGVYTATCPGDWVRGAINLGDVNYQVDQVGGGASTFNFPALNVYVQDVSVFLRDRSTINDSDAFGLASLEERDQAANSLSDQISWFLDDNGRVNCSYLTSLGDITWSSTAVRDMLGFRGDESPVTYSTVYSLLKATRKAGGVLIPSRPYQQHHIAVDNVGQSRRLIGGGYVSNYIGTYAISSLNFDLDARLDQVDDYQHFIHNWLIYCGLGERVNFYQCWGDSRRVLRDDQITATQKQYDLLYTGQNNGDFGRIRASLITNRFDLIYPGRLRRRVPVSMELEHL